MKVKEYAIVPLFERFIKESINGRRLKKDGTSISPGTIKNYHYVLRYLMDFQKEKRYPLRLKTFNGSNTRMFLQEKKILG